MAMVSGGESGDPEVIFTRRPVLPLEICSTLDGARQPGGTALGEVRG